jgi:hypothetical protein
LHAISDSVSATIGTPVLIHALQNDIHTNGKIISINNEPAATLVSDDTIRFSATAEMGTGAHTFTYTVEDQYGASDDATISVRINPAPVVALDDAAVALPSVNAINVTANDRGDHLHVINVTTPAHGKATQGGDNIVLYEPAKGYIGDDAFEYSVASGTQRSTATVRVKVITPELHAVNDTATTTAEQSVDIDVLRNDAAYDPPELATCDATSPHGTITRSGAGLRYTPVGAYVGKDEFNYTIRDRFGSTASAHVAVSITAPPIAINPDEVEMTADTQQTIRVLQNDKGADLVLDGVVAQPLHGTATTNADGNVTYAPAPGYHGDDVFEYRARDRYASAGNAIVNIRIEVPALPAPDFSIMTTALDPTTITVLSATAPNQSKLLSITGLKTGRATFTSDGHITYTPDPNAAPGATERYSYTIGDKYGSQATGNVTITIGTPRTTAPLQPAAPSPPSW